LPAFKGRLHDVIDLLLFETECCDLIHRLTIVVVWMAPPSPTLPWLALIRQSVCPGIVSSHRIWADLMFEE